MRRVLIATRTFGKYTDEPINYLKDNGFEIVRYEKGDISEYLKNVDALIIGTHPTITGEMIENSSLQIIARHGVGIDNVDVEAATKKGIPVTITYGANAVSVAELTIAFMFALAKKIIKAHRSVLEENSWPSIVGMELCGKTLGLLGFGAVGREVAKRAVALSMRVIAYDPYVNKEEMEKMGVTPVEFEKILKESDFVSIHVPLTEKTRNLIGERELRMMKESSFLINTARGGIVDEKALARALKERWIAGAALDVFEEEPPSFESPLFKCENLIATPHMAAHTFEAIYRMNMMAASSIVDYFNGRIPKYIVNKEVVEKLKEKGFKG